MDRLGDAEGFLYSGNGEGDVRLKMDTGDGELGLRPDPLAEEVDWNNDDGVFPAGDTRPLVLPANMGEIFRRDRIGDRIMPKGERRSLSGDTGDLGRLSLVPKILVFASKASVGLRSLDGVLERIPSSGDLLRMEDVSSALSKR